MYDLGGRKFFLTSIGPVGCLPYEKWQFNSTNGSCLEYANIWVEYYNARLQIAMQQMMVQTPGLYLLYGNAYDKVYAYSQEPEQYGTMPNVDLLIIIL